jgi:hypothetical protein
LARLFSSFSDFFSKFWRWLSSSRYFFFPTQEGKRNREAKRIGKKEGKRFMIWEIEGDFAKTKEAKGKSQ